MEDHFQDEKWTIWMDDHAIWIDQRSEYIYASVTSVLWPFMKNFLVVYFDYILIYSHSCEQQFRALVPSLYCVEKERILCKSESLSFFQHKSTF